MSDTDCKKNKENVLEAKLFERNLDFGFKTQCAVGFGDFRVLKSKEDFLKSLFK